MIYISIEHIKNPRLLKEYILEHGDEKHLGCLSPSLEDAIIHNPKLLKQYLTKLTKVEMKLLKKLLEDYKATYTLLSTLKTNSLEFFEDYKSIVVLAYNVETAKEAFNKLNINNHTLFAKWSKRTIKIIGLDSYEEDKHYISMYTLEIPRVLKHALPIKEIRKLYYTYMHNNGSMKLISHEPISQRYYNNIEYILERIMARGSLRLNYIEQFIDKIIKLPPKKLEKLVEIEKKLESNML